MKNKTKTIVFLGLCTALALVLAYVEMLLPPLYAAVPGVKMGLPNIVIMFLLYRKGPLSAAVVSLLRLVLVTLLFGNAMAFLYSLAGAVISLPVMMLLKKLGFLSEVGVSVVGGVMHNVGQILMAMLLLQTVELAYYLVALTLSGIAAGVLVGLGAAFLIRRVPRDVD